MNQSSPHHGAPDPRHRAVPRSRTARRASRGRARVVVIGLLAVAALVGGGAWMWLNRTVSVRVNGTLTQVRADATLEDIFAAEKVEVAPGNLVSVGGNVLTEGGGAPFSATVGGSELDAGQIEAFRARGNEEIVFGDGADVTEASREEERETAPKMEPYGQVGAITFVAQWPRPGRGVYAVGDVSGEAVLKEELEPVQNAVIQSINPTPDDGSKLIALTFDDGPSAYTQRYLDILSEHGARATFFCLGSAAAANPDLVKAIEAQGSQVASHTQNHKQLTTLDAATLQSEVVDAFSALSSSGAPATTVLRPPYGDFNNDTWLASGGTLSASVIWNLDSEDWRLPGADAIVANCTNGAYSGAIVLMHDGGGNRDQDLEALPRIIEALQARGYKFVTINELMASDSRIPADVASGNATPPEGFAWPTEMVAAG
ncbi:MAG TPA: polysaccharide deacetylase family protein [Candidatus Olsenella stercoravium]|uniref:Polysaccharide deacetylase family protein n=1 Tax=Candidatus Olsenella stercoravium TaxID=2838713 RepID=A0A9D2DK27_9ACTN|nr:polysaccharide deacetylase family protein [Candidatus Olsenella stercoravium]